MSKTHAIVLILWLAGLFCLVGCASQQAVVKPTVAQPSTAQVSNSLASDFSRFASFSFRNSSEVNSVHSLSPSPHGDFLKAGSYKLHAATLSHANHLFVLSHCSLTQATVIQISPDGRRSLLNLRTPRQLAFDAGSFQLAVGQNHIWVSAWNALPSRGIAAKRDNWMVMLRYDLRGRLKQQVNLHKTFLAEEDESAKGRKILQSIDAAEDFSCDSADNLYFAVNPLNRIVKLSVTGKITAEYESGYDSVFITPDGMLVGTYPLSQNKVQMELRDAEGRVKVKAGLTIPDFRIGKSSVATVGMDNSGHFYLWCWSRTGKGFSMSIYSATLSNGKVKKIAAWTNSSAAFQDYRFCGTQPPQLSNDMKPIHAVVGQVLSVDERGKVLIEVANDKSYEVWTTETQHP